MRGNWHVGAAQTLSEAAEGCVKSSSPDVFCGAASSVQHKHPLQRLDDCRGPQQAQSHDGVVVFTECGVDRLVK